MKLDPIIAVKDVEESSRWYQELFELKSKHGGSEFEILTTEQGEVVLCLHPWGAHGHPSMADPKITPGNGLILYFRTDRLEEIRKKLEVMGATVEEEIHLNSNSLHREFSVRDPDSYYLTVTENHAYEG